MDVIFIKKLLTNSSKLRDLLGFTPIFLEIYISDPDLLDLLIYSG